jgi:FkbM family methyltransferase
MNAGPTLRTFCRTFQAVENWPTAIGLRLFRRSPRLRLLSFRNGLNALVRGATSDWDVVSELVLANAYGFALDYIRNLPGRPVVLDLGANIGIFSLLAAAAHKDARVFAYEPAPPNLRMIRLNCLANADLSDRIEVRSEAAGGETRMTDFLYDEANPQASGMCYAKGTVFRVQIRSFADVLESLPRPVDVAKIDIEGAEFEILEKTPPELWQRVSAVCVEVHDDPSAKLSLQSFLKRMADYGYTHQLQPVGTCTYFLQRRSSMTPPRRD